MIAANPPFSHKLLLCTRSLRYETYLQIVFAICLGLLRLRFLMIQGMYLSTKRFEQSSCNYLVVIY